VIVTPNFEFWHLNYTTNCQAIAWTLPLQRMRDCNPCPSQPASLPPATKARRSHMATTRHPWCISTRLQRQRRQSKRQSRLTKASGQRDRLSNFKHMIFGHIANTRPWP